MKTISDKFNMMVAGVPQVVMTEVDLSFAIADEIYALMQERGLTKKQFAEALGKKPSEVTKWLSGQHNFTIRTLAMLSSFFGVQLICPGPVSSGISDVHNSMRVADDAGLEG